MPFETEPERILKDYVKLSSLKDEFNYIEYGKDFVRFKKDGGSVFEISVKEKKRRK